VPLGNDWKKRHSRAADHENGIKGLVSSKSKALSLNADSRSVTQCHSPNMGEFGTPSGPFDC